MIFDGLCKNVIITASDYNPNFSSLFNTYMNFDNGGGTNNFSYQSSSISSITNKFLKINFIQPTVLYNINLNYTGCNQVGIFTSLDNQNWNFLWTGQFLSSQLIFDVRLRFLLFYFMNVSEILTVNQLNPYIVETYDNDKILTPIQDILLPPKIAVNQPIFSSFVYQIFNIMQTNTASSLRVLNPYYKISCQEGIRRIL